ncbi:MAG: TetR/AcrR family transcriptional regulator C-terminal domain-containing protein [Aliidongia sp.]
MPNRRRSPFPSREAAYLRDALSKEQLALYRVVARDADRFPELGRRYHAEMVGRRIQLVAGYLDRWAETAGWQQPDPTDVAQTFEALLRAGLFDAALHGLRLPSEAEIATQAAEASARLLILLEAKRL